MFQPIHTAPESEIVMIITSKGLITLAIKRQRTKTWAVVKLALNCEDYRADANGNNSLIPIGWMPLSVAISKLMES